MLTFLRELLWDKAAARTALLALIALGAAYYNTPSGRPWHERLIGAAASAAVVGGAAASWRPTQGGE